MTTDSNKDAHLICYVRFLGDNIIIEDLFCKSMIGSAKAQDFFEMLDKFITENGLDWEKCIGMCTDGGRSISDYYGKLQALISSKAPDAMCQQIRQISSKSEGVKKMFAFL